MSIDLYVRTAPLDPRDVAARVVRTVEHLEPVQPLSDRDDPLGLFDDLQGPSEHIATRMVDCDDEEAWADGFAAKYHSDEIGMSLNLRASAFLFVVQLFERAGALISLDDQAAKHHPLDGKHGMRGPHGEVASYKLDSGGTHVNRDEAAFLGARLHAFLAAAPMVDDGDGKRLALAADSPDRDAQTMLMWLRDVADLFARGGEHHGVEVW